MDYRISIKIPLLLSASIACCLTLHAEETVTPVSLENKIDSLLINNQKRDPFGLYQNSKDKPKIRTTSLKNKYKRPTKVESRKLSEILDQLKVNGVNPSRREFIIGLKRFREGQTLPLTSTIKVKVIKVTSSSISFENVDNKESATLNIGKRNLLQKTNKNLNSLLSSDGESTPLLPE